MHLSVLLVLPCLITATVGAWHQPPSCPDVYHKPSNGSLGTCPNDFTIIGEELQAVHESVNAPTGLAVDNDLNVYIAYPRNTGPNENNVVIATGFDSEAPWPSAEIQKCAAGQDLSTCFVNVQNPVLDSQGVMWVVDSGIPPGQKTAVEGGAKIMSFNISTRKLLRSYTVPSSLFYGGLNINDVRINNTLGTKGYAFMTDESSQGSIVSIDLDTGATQKRLFNTTVVKADPGYVGSFDGRPIYSWKNTTKVFTSTGADGITLASGNVYWGNLASRRFYYVPQTAVVNASLSDAEVLAAVVYPGNCATEQAGFTADDRGRVYIMASEQNAIYYVDTQQCEVTETINDTPPGGSGPVAPENYVMKTLVRNAQIQHADSAAILHGWLYFCTNQLLLSPTFQYKNIDARKGPFKTYRYWIGRGPAV